MIVSTSGPRFMGRWPTAYPRHRGCWTLRSRDGRWGSLDPETHEIATGVPENDPELPALRGLLARGDLIGYRVGRRAVIRTPETTFLKVVRPKRLAALIRAHETATGTPSAMMVPEVLHSDPAGWVELGRVPGRSLHDALRAATPVRGGIDDICAVGRALAEFHQAPPSPTLTHRVLDDPARWIDTVGRIEPLARAELTRVATELPVLTPTGGVAVHGDLHDKNVFVARDGVGLIDLDGLGLGAPEDDVANLAVHLRLRALQAGADALLGEQRADCLYAAYSSVRPLDPVRVDAVERHTWFRLACLYRFRDGSRHLTPELLRRARG